MAEYSRFFGGPAGSVPSYTQTNFAEVLKRFISDGYIPSVDNELEVVETTPAAMSVDVSTGEGFVQGFWYQNDAALTVNISAADATHPRIDRIVLRLDASTDCEITAEVLEGTPAASPTAPALTQTSSTYEISLAQVEVGAGATSITNANITDERTAAIAPNVASETDLTALETDLRAHEDKNTSEAHDPLLQNYRETCVVANSGVTYTFDLSLGNVFEITLTDDCTFTMPSLPAAPSGGVGEALSFTVRLKQDGTGNRAPTFNTTIWPEGEAPELSTGAGEIDKLVFTGWPGETNWEGDLAGVNYSAVS